MPLIVVRAKSMATFEEILSSKSKCFWTLNWWITIKIESYWPEVTLNARIIEDIKWEHSCLEDNMHHVFYHA